MIRFRPLPLIIFSTAACCGLLLSSGCESRPSRTHADDASAARPIAMSGQTDFFDGKITASVTVSRGSGRPGGATGEGGTRGPGRRGGGGRQRGGGEGMNSDPAASYAGTVHPSSLPVVTIRLSLENHTTSPVDVEITEASSALGNFAVRPDKLTLAPQATQEPDPMFSQLGVAAEEIPVKVGLKIAGMGETKEVAVKTIRGDAATVAP